jgi:ABC-type phosphate transport system permease subunit
MSTTQAVTAGAVHRSLQGKRIDLVGYVFSGLLLGSLLFTLAILAVLVGDQFQRGLPVLLERGTDLLTSSLSSRPDRAGVIQGLVGTAMLAVMVSVIAFPIGILTAPASPRSSTGCSGLRSSSPCSRRLGSGMAATSCPEA